MYVFYTSLIIAVLYVVQARTRSHRCSYRYVNTRYMYLRASTLVRYYHSPIQARGPSPNGIYVYLFDELKFSGLNRSGRNSEGFSK